jgi:hypothetical protein
LPARRVGPPPRAISKLPSSRTPPRTRFPESAKRAPPSGFPDHGAGSIHGLRSHEARSTSQLPARSIRPHCASRPRSTPARPPRLPGTNTPTSARVARTMKSPPLLRLPETTASTSLHGVPARAPHPRPVSQTTKLRRLAGHPNSRATAPPSFPSGEAAPAARVTSALEPTPPPWLPRTSALAPSHRLLEPRDLDTTPGCPNIDRGLAALIRREAGPFVRLPARRFRPHCTDAHAGGTRFAQSPARSVSSSRSHLRGERVAVRLNHGMVAHPMTRSRTASSDPSVTRAIGSPRAWRAHLAVARSMSAPRRDSVRPVARAPFSLRDFAHRPVARVMSSSSRP